MTLFNDKPREYALNLVDDGMATDGELLSMMINHMTSQDVKDCLTANELAPLECSDCESEIDGRLNGETCQLCEDCQNAVDEKEAIDEWLAELEDTHDIELMRADIENNNLDVDGDETPYEFENIVTTSIINGQHSQARSQADRYGLNYEELKQDISDTIGE